MKPSGIGGQAVMEGVMMKNKSEYAVAVRKADQAIVVKKESYRSISEKIPVFKAPFLRGIVNFLESLYLGMNTLMYSASFFEEEELKRKEEWEDWIRTGTGVRFTGDEKKRKKGAVGAAFQKAVEKFSMFLLLVCSFGLAVGLFVLLPMFLSEYIAGTETSTGKAVLEGVFRLLIFFIYLFLISKMEDIERVFMYHGAEHKTINCVENGQELTIENIRKQPRQHKRCGTSFLFLVIILSIIFFVFIRTEILWQKIVFRLVLVPVIAAVSYEFIRLAGRSENPVVSMLSKPGMWFQNLTTREPDDDMIEVAIRSVEAVFDWRAFLSEDGENGGITEMEPEAETEAKTELEAETELDAETEYYAVSENKREIGKKKIQMSETDGEERENQKNNGKENDEIPEQKTLSMITKERLLRTISKDEYKIRKEEQEKEDNLKTDEEQNDVLLNMDTSGRLKPDTVNEDDAILKALDKYFGE
jgi:uncharacterized protein YqhQ